MFPSPLGIRQMSATLISSVTAALERNVGFTDGSFQRVQKRHTVFATILVSLIGGLVFSAPARSQQLERGDPVCTPQAVASAQAGAERKEPAAIYLLARYFSTGKCIPGDGKRAMELYMEAALLNYPPAFYNLGMVSAAHRDLKAAEAYFSKGALLGHRGCEFQLGILYSFPNTAVSNDAKAFAWLSLVSSRTDEPIKDGDELLSKIKARLTSEQRQTAEAMLADLKSRYGSTPAFRSNN